MRVEREFDLERALEDVVQRLVRRFGRDFDGTEVEVTVRMCAERFADARITVFVPVLVERRTVDHLTERLRTTRWEVASEAKAS